MQKLGKNLGAYYGEMIDIRAVLGDIETAAQQHGWTSETFHEVDGVRMIALHRAPAPAANPQPPRRIYISAGIHGDEPAGPSAVLRLLQENRWPKHLEIFLIPCLNPTGFLINKRGNASGIDLNRDYRNSKNHRGPCALGLAAGSAAEIRFISLPARRLGIAWLLSLRTKPPTASRLSRKKMIEAVKPVCPVDMSEIIEDRPASGGIIRPVLNPFGRPDWPEAFYLITEKSRQGLHARSPLRLSPARPRRRPRRGGKCRVGPG